MKKILVGVLPLLMMVASGSAIAQAAGSERLLPYRINAGDELEIYVWGEERLQRSVKVLPDGSFSFPLAGAVDAAGRLTSEIEAELTKKLEPQFRTQVPQVTVSVRSTSGMQISVIGKVKTPGSFTPGKYINVLEAIGIAGGPSEFADVGSVLILRKRGGALVPIRVRLTSALRGAPTAQDLAVDGIPQLQSGDTVIVP